MRSRTGYAILVAGIAAAIAPAGGSAGKSSAPPKPSVVEGILIDTKCYSVDRRNAGDDHGAGDDKIEACATACAKMGIPVAVLTGKGEVYILLAPTPAFEERMGKPVRVTGAKVFGGSAIRPEKVETHAEDGSWTALDIHSMM